MMKLTQLIFWRPYDEPRPLSERAPRLLAGFLAVMVLCTLLSRGADSLTVPKVTVENPVIAAITHTTRLDGTLEPQLETRVVTVSGILVDSIQAQPGSQVEEGDPLFTFNQDSLEKALLRQRTQLQKLRLEWEGLKNAASLEDKQKALAYDRAYEDYSDAFDRSYDSLEDARKTRKEALVALREYYQQHQAVIDRWTGGTLPPGTSLPPETDEETREILSRYYALKGEYEAADEAYEGAQDSRRDAWKAAQRALEDAQLALDYNDSARQGEIAALSCVLEEESLRELETLLNEGGVVTAPERGVVSQMLVTPGQATTEAAAAMVAGEESGFLFTAQLTQEQLEYVALGDEATITLPGNRSVKTQVVGLQNVEDGQGMMTRLTAVVPQDSGTLGARGTVEITRKTGSYNLCVPVSALHSDGSKKYLLVLEEQETVLGAQLTARRVDVQVEDQNETRAAVAGALSREDRVIVDTSKTVREGDRVRLMAS